MLGQHHPITLHQLQTIGTNKRFRERQSVNGREFKLNSLKERQREMLSKKGGRS
jgi:hypothetical protein